MEQCARCGREVNYEKQADGEYCSECGWEKQAAAKFIKANPTGSLARKAIDQSIYSIDYLAFGFKYDNSEYRYEDIQGIDYSANDIRTRHHLFISSYAQTSNITITFTNRTKLLIGASTRSMKMPQGVSPEQSFLHRAYLRLVKESVPFRMRKYLDEFKHSGSFLWNGVKWFKSELEKGKLRCQYDDCELLISATMLTIKVDKNTQKRSNRNTITVRLLEEREMAEAILEHVLNMQIGNSAAVGKDEGMSEAP